MRVLYYYAALLRRRGPHIASHSVCPSVCLSVCPSVPLSLPSVTSFRQPLALRMYFSARTESIRTFRHALQGRISYGHLGRTNSCCLLLFMSTVLLMLTAMNIRNIRNCEIQYSEVHFYVVYYNH